MNLPNSITVTRIFLVPLLVVVLLTEFEGRVVIFGIRKELLGAGIFGVASLTDWLDGYLARRRKQITPLGQIIDPFADKLLTSAAFLSLVQMNLVSAWIVAIIIGSEFAVTGLRHLAYTRGVPIPASPLGKIKMVAQVVAILALILGDVYQPRLLIVGAIALWVVVLTTLVSAFDYFGRFSGLVGARAPAAAAPRGGRSDGGRLERARLLARHQQIAAHHGGAGRGHSHERGLRVHGDRHRLADGVQRQSRHVQVAIDPEAVSRDNAGAFASVDDHELTFGDQHALVVAEQHPRRSAEVEDAARVGLLDTGGQRRFGIRLQQVARPQPVAGMLYDRDRHGVVDRGDPDPAGREHAALALDAHAAQGAAAHEESLVEFNPLGAPAVDDHEIVRAEQHTLGRVLRADDCQPGAGGARLRDDRAARRDGGARGDVCRSGSAGSRRERDQCERNSWQHAHHPFVLAWAGVFSSATRLRASSRCSLRSNSAMSRS